MRNKKLKKLKILLVEDEEKLATLLKNAIGDNFHSFTTAYDGKEGLRMFSSICPDIIITDITMPKMTGLEMAQEIKKINTNIPIIILSAFSDTDKLLNAIDIGVAKYFIKPFDPEELLEYISSISENLESKLIELEENFSFNLSTKSLYKNDRFVALTKKENIFIQLLLQNIDTKKNVSYEIIKNKLWKDEEVSDERLRTFIRRLRAKTSKFLILNFKGEGYQIATSSPK
ncbi:MAG: response regulator transcription factor [Sulfurimonas sp.]|nr:response regulator transcription factor [Sulfurimonas sp.]